MLYSGLKNEVYMMITKMCKVNDIVKDSGTMWICTTYHTSSVSVNLTPDEANWAVFIPGLEFEDTWGPYSEYQVGDVVTYGGYTYVAKTNNSEKKPAESPNDWDVFITGFNLRGEWGADSTNQDYRTGDVVTLGGYTYLAKANSNGIQPPNTTYWDKLNEGFNFRLFDGNITNVDKKGSINLKFKESSYELSKVNSKKC